MDNELEMTEQLTNEECERIYQNAMILMDGGLYSEAADEFARIPDYKDAASLMSECEEKQTASRLDEIYADADKAAANMNVRSQEKAIAIFKTIPGYRDADERVKQAEQTIEEIVEKERAEREEGMRIAKENEEKAKLRKKRWIRIAALSALAIILCVTEVFLFKKYAIPEIHYRRGVKQMQAGDYDEAYANLHELNIHDSSELVAKIATERLKDAEIGSTVLFGAYPQGRITSKEKTPVEWIVLDKDGSKLMLITKDAVDALPYMRYDYERQNMNVTWSNSLLREWLNDTFLKTAFNEGESRMVQRTRLVTNDGGSGTQVTVDKVYVLSTQEANKYFADDEARKCYATKYALGFGAYRSSIDNTCLWWLRTPNTEDVEMVEIVDESNIRYRVFCIGTAGQIIYAGHEILNTYGVRPVVWVDTDTLGR
ncbi:MAG: hypothetical protein J5772_02120 [Clostridia bacterium]|nr:hypothetical protein [Clostridia bacterium]